jgi:hypothetical protein
MSQDQNQVAEKSQQMMQGPLKHVRGAALAAALVPLASVMATPASAQAVCGSGGFCGYVWNDTDKDGVHDDGEPGISGASVTIDGVNPDTGETFHLVVPTGPDGVYYAGFPPNGTYTVSVQMPPDTEATTPDVGDDWSDSDGTPNGTGDSVATVTYYGTDPNVDFGFWQAPVAAPGTGTPGYWKNHPEAWPAAGITVGGVYYPTALAISWLDQVGKDKTTTMFSSLVSAMLNVMVGNNSSCVASTIAAAEAWMTTYPLGSNVAASSYAWKIGEPMHRLMDNYNNGMLCAPHRD